MQDIPVQIHDISVRIHGIFEDIRDHMKRSFLPCLLMLMFWPPARQIVVNLQ
jgi:hypothetical protein